MDMLILLLPLVLLFFIMSRGRKQQRQLSDLQASLAPGQEVITTAGLHGRIVEVHDTSVVLEVAPGVRTTWARPAIGRRLDAVAPAEPDTGASAATLTEPDAAPGSRSSARPSTASSPLGDQDPASSTDRPDRTDR